MNENNNTATITFPKDTVIAILNDRLKEARRDIATLTADNDKLKAQTVRDAGALVAKDDLEISLRNKLAAMVAAYNEARKQAKQARN